MDFKDKKARSENGAPNSNKMLVNMAESPPSQIEFDAN
jgi:hypothetical protein